MKIRNLLIIAGLILLLLAGATALFLLCIVPNRDFGFCREVSLTEQELRVRLVTQAQTHLGTVEDDENHHRIIDLYNVHEPLAQNYAVTYEDSWCAAFASTVAIECGMTDIIPTECSCQRQIELFKNLDRWEESDRYMPLPGDYIYYAWDDRIFGDCTGWADHVGIVVGTWGPFIKVIEGNFDDQVGYHYILRDDPTIRGYAVPDYPAKCE